jgi:hypothetical protein
MNWRKFGWVPKVFYVLVFRPVHYSPVGSPLRQVDHIIICLKNETNFIFLNRRHAIILSRSMSRGMGSHRPPSINSITLSLTDDTGMTRHRQVHYSPSTLRHGQPRIVVPWGKGSIVLPGQSLCCLLNIF